MTEQRKSKESKEPTQPIIKEVKEYVVDKACLCGHYLSQHKRTGRCKYCDKKRCDIFRFSRFILNTD